MNILVFGASITWGATDAEGGWVDRLKRHFLARYQSERGERIRVYNLGIPGETSADLRKRFEIEASPRLNSEPNKNCIIFFIGANDSAFLHANDHFAVDPDHYYDNMKHVISKAQTFADRVIVLTISPVDEASPNLIRKGKIRKNEFVLKYNHKLKLLQQELGCELVDMYTTLQNTNEQLFDQDGLHPNTRGHEVLFETMRTILK